MDFHSSLLKSDIALNIALHAQPELDIVNSMSEFSQS